MTAVDLVRALLLELGVLAMTVCGLLLVLSVLWPRLRRATGRAALLAVLLTIVSVLVTPEWLP